MELFTLAACTWYPWHGKTVGSNRTHDVAICRTHRMGDGGTTVILAGERSGKIIIRRTGIHRCDNGGGGLYAYVLHYY